MVENSKIEWCDHTFNPWKGCSKVSPGCEHCYAEAVIDKRFKAAEWGPYGTRVRTAPANWRLPIKWNRQAIEAGTRPRVFCASLADVFEDYSGGLAIRADGSIEPGIFPLDAWREDLFGLINATPALDWLLLTKRPAAVLKWIDRTRNELPQNVWLGVSVEDQERANERLPMLARISAALRFVSYEPALGPVEWGPWLDSIDWLIAGGESGSGARPFGAGWLQGTLRQCRRAGVPLFVKQLGVDPYGFPDPISGPKGGDPAEWPEWARIREYPSPSPAK